MLDALGRAYQILDPFSLIPLFYNYAYAILFLLNLAAFIYFLARDKDAVAGIYATIRDSSKATLGCLALIILFFISNCLYSMEPLNNIIPTTTEDIYQAEQLKSHFRFTLFDAPHGFSTMLAIIRLTGLDYTHILTGFGVIIGSATAIMLFVVLKKYTGSQPISLLGPLLFVSLDETILYSTSRVNTLTLSSFLILFLLFLYATDTKKDKRFRLIIFLTTLLVYIRIENTALLAAVFGLAIHRHFSKKKLLIFEYALAYVIFMPHLMMHFNYRAFLNSPEQGYVLGLHNIGMKLASFGTVVTEFFPTLLIVLMLVGAVHLVARKDWAFPAIFFSVLLVYIFLRIYDVVLIKHVYCLLPLMVVAICLGAHQISTLLRNRAAQYAVAAALLTIIIINGTYFSKIAIDSHYILPNMQAGEKYAGHRLILYGYRDLLYSFQRFYSNYTLANDVIEPFDDKPTLEGDYDFLIHISEQGPNEEITEEKLGLNLALVDKQGIVSVYRVNK